MASVLPYSNPSPGRFSLLPAGEGPGMREGGSADPRKINLTAEFRMIGL
jgi:hypothetical protein